VSGAVPLFVSVACCAELVVPTRWEPNERLDVSVTAGPGWVPDPVSATLCGLAAASSVIETDALLAPGAAGEKVTLSVQVAFTASCAGAAGQSFVCAKSAEFVPSTPMLAIVSGAVPEFCRVVLCAALVVPTVWPAKVRLAGVRVTAGAVPVPLSAAVCGLPGALSVMETLAERLPAPPGVNVTETVHVALTASVAGETGQSFACAKSPAFAPVTAMPLIESGAVPELRTEIVCAAAVVPTRCEPNPRLLGESVIAVVAVPVPVRDSVCGLPVALSVTVTAAVRVPDPVGENVTEIVHVAFAASVAGDIGQVVVRA
jgi:hypothetical protein